MTPAEYIYQALCSVPELSGRAAQDHFLAPQPAPYAVFMLSPISDEGSDTKPSQLRSADVRIELYTLAREDDLEEAVRALFPTLPMTVSSSYISAEHITMTVIEFTMYMKGLS